MLRFPLTAVTALGVIPWSGARPQLFDAVEPLRITLTADFGAVAKDRGTTKHPQPGVLSYVAPSGDSVSLPVSWSTIPTIRSKPASSAS